MEQRTWLWLRGLTRAIPHWGDSEEIWKSRHPLDVILHVEIPGCGEKYQETSAFSIGENVERMRLDLEAQKERLGITGPVHVFAVSLGGMITAEWLTRYPQDFSSATIINSSSAGLSKPWERILPSALVTLMAASRIADPFKREQKILSLLTNSTTKLKEFIKSFGLESQAHPVSRTNAMIQIGAASVYHWPQVKPQVPVLILTAEQDRMVSYQCSLKIADYWNCPYEVHPTAGHELTLDDTSWVMDQVDHFLLHHGLNIPNSV